MERPEQFNNSVDTLVKAFFDGTLKKGHCSACAVGSLCGGSALWTYKFMTSDVRGEGVKQFDGWIECYRDGGQSGVPAPRNKKVGDAFFSPRIPFDEAAAIADETIAQSGYTEEELRKIEYAFEIAETEGEPDENGNYNSIQSQFNGLMAVLDVLFDIHKVNDEDIKAAERLKFESHPALA